MIFEDLDLLVSLDRPSVCAGPGVKCSACRSILSCGGKGVGVRVGLGVGVRLRVGVGRD